MLSIVLAACGSEGDPVDDVDNVSPDPVTSVSFAKGADISWASEMERDGVSFSAQKGYIHLIKGEIGSGKSTIGKILCGVLPGFRGEITGDGKELTVAHRVLLIDHPEHRKRPDWLL